MPYIGNAGRFSHIFLAKVNEDNDANTTTTPSTSVNYNFNEITIGKDAGKLTQGKFAVAVGAQCGETLQNTQSVAMGYKSGQSKDPAATATTE